jgi:hypothetical protein
MEIITKEKLKANPEIKGAYQSTLHINGQEIELDIVPDDVALEKAIELANKIIGNLGHYDQKAKQKLAEDFLKKYNDHYRNEKTGEPELDEKSFSKQLTLIGITIVSDDSIDFFYYENLLFGGQSLIAQLSDGENFDATAFFG